jgi:choline dehydrogenase-like flavoprotein
MSGDLPGAGRSRSGGAREEIATDVCVIGAGPAGITVARQLEGTGLRVCLMESGGRTIERSVQAQSRGESDGYPLHPLDDARIRAFGGTLRHPRIWDDGWASRPLDPIDLSRRSWLGDAAWPFPRKELDGYYARAELSCGVLPETEAASRWRDSATPEARALAGGQLAPAIFQFPTQAFHDAWEALSTATDVRLLLHTRVVEFEVDPTGRRIERVLALREGRHPVAIRARTVVLATGGIENARLLLAANGRRGLGNEHGLVGRYFAERLTYIAGHVEVDDPTSVDRLSSLQRSGGLVGGGLRVAEAVQQERGLMNCALFLIPRPAAVTTPAMRSLSTLRKGRGRRPRPGALGDHVRNIVTGPRSLVDLGLSKLTERPRSLVIRVQAEPGPNPESRVRLGHGTDDLGLPVARVTWRMTEADRESARASVEVLHEGLRRHGLGRVAYTARLDSTTLIEGNHHHLGTTRMHENPREGVVDANCRVHSVDNLYVAGSSVFPTYGASNPTLTIVALAVRLADHLCNVLASS